MSGDDAETLRRFRGSLKSKDTFVADPNASLIKLFDVKMPLVKMAKRTTFVIGPGRRILSVIEGGEAIDPQNSVRACTLPQSSETGSTDAGVSR